MTVLLVLFLLPLAACQGPPAAAATRFVVDCSRAAALGAGAGNATSPFWSLAAAQAAVRRLPRPLTAPVFVSVLPGSCFPRNERTGEADWTLPHLALTSADSGGGVNNSITW